MTPHELTDDRGVPVAVRSLFGAATRQGLVVLASSDDGPHGVLLHVSLSYRDRLPAWEVVRAVRDAFYPDDVDGMMMLPRREDYVNLHPYTWHLTQCPDRWGIR